jgi:hypothetical protein
MAEATEGSIVQVSLWWSSQRMDPISIAHQRGRRQNGRHWGAYIRGVRLHIRGVRLHVRGVRLHIRGVRLHVRGVRLL